MIPKIAIVGRPNVGKSSLLNLMARRRISIVDPTAGVTRDRIAYLHDPDSARDVDRVTLTHKCELIDTGGYGVYSGDGTLSPLTDHIENQIELALFEADLVLFVLDGQDGVTTLDEEIARLIRERLAGTKPIMLIANKVDSSKMEAQAVETVRLGFGDPLFISAKTGYMKQDACKAIDAELARIIADSDDESDDVAEGDGGPSEMMLAIVGKRNAGKSTLVNALAGFERVIASELEGTTRDSIDVRFEMDGRAFTAIDTAGVRKRKSMEDDIEYYSYHRALRSVRRADVVLLLIDSTKDISQVDKKLSKEIQEKYKPCVIVLNKWDLVQDRLNPDDYLVYVADALRGLDYAPIACISAAKNEDVDATIEAAIELYEQAGTRVGTGELNEVVQSILKRRGPSPRLGKEAKIYYATMPTVYPPTIVLFVNQPELFDDRYKRYMINKFRELLPFPEVPIKLLVRGRRRERGRKAGREIDMAELGPEFEGSTESDWLDEFEEQDDRLEDAGVDQDGNEPEEFIEE